MYPDGSYYDGQWEKDKQHGYGTEVGVSKPKFKLDGSRYEGEFQAGLRHGKGTLSLPDGSSYSGDFEAGEFSGRGRY